MDQTDTDQQKYLAAKAHVEAIKGFYIHLFVFAAVMIGLFAAELRQGRFLVGAVAVHWMGPRHIGSRLSRIFSAMLYRRVVGRSARSKRRLLKCSSRESVYRTLRLADHLLWILIGPATASANYRGFNCPTALDPVCGMTSICGLRNTGTIYGGRNYYFCSGRCREKFAANPGQYLKPVPQAATPATHDTIYTCPMHPEIRKVGPGNCPICGMALEPEVVSGDDAANPELIDMTRRLLDWSRIHCARVCPRDGWPSDRASSVAGPAVIELDSTRIGHARRPLGRSGRSLNAAGHRSGLSISTCSHSSPWERALLGFTASSGRFFRTCSRRLCEGTMARLPVYFEAAAVITVLVLFGQVLELKAREQTSGAIRALLDLSPKSARRIGQNRHRRGRQPRSRHRRRPACVCGPENGCLSMAISSKAAAPLMNRWSPGNRCLSPKALATRSLVAP